MEKRCLGRLKERGRDRPGDNSEMGSPPPIKQAFGPMVSVQRIMGDVWGSGYKRGCACGSDVEARIEVGAELWTSSVLPCLIDAPPSQSHALSSPPC